MEDALQGFYQIHGISWSSKIRKSQRISKRGLRKVLLILYLQNLRNVHLPQEVQQKILSLTSIALELCDIIS